MKFQKIIFLVSSLSQPRAIRRVESVASLGVDVVVYGYDRKQYNCNKFPVSIHVNVLGEMSKGGGYVGKLKQIKRDIKRIIAEHKEEKCLYYSFGFLETMFLRRAMVPYSYEISDIAYSGGVLVLLRPLLKMIDRHLVKRAVFTLMTSEGFKRYLNVNNANILIQPNKVNRKLLGCDRHVLKLIDNKFIFSFVGSIRYDTILRFAKVVAEHFPQHQFHFYGVANVDSTQKFLDNLTTKYNNIKMFGPFVNPDDFEKIYNNVDIIVTTYGLTFNEKILDPNKLYEGLLFCRPLIATEGTFLAEQVRKHECGFVIDSSTEESIVNFIETLTAEKLNAISAKEKAIDDTYPFDDTVKLSGVIKQIVEFTNELAIQ